jgi:hypothetical protein
MKKKIITSPQRLKIIHIYARIGYKTIFYVPHIWLQYNIIMRTSWLPSTWPRQPVHLSGNNDRFVLTTLRDAIATAGVVAKGVPTRRLQSWQMTKSRLTNEVMMDNVYK